MGKSQEIHSIARSMESLQKCAALSTSWPAKEHLGSKHTPLLHIQPDHVIPDKLHRLFTVTEVLIHNIIFEMFRLDHSAVGQRYQR